MSCMDGTEFSPEMMAGRYRRLDTGEVELILHGMVPPEPALCILHVLQSEAPETLIAKLDRNPVNLYEALEERGWQVVDGGPIPIGFQVVIKALNLPQ